jgi:hypothetical protein
MFMVKIELTSRPDEATWRAKLGSELGARRAAARNVELQWSASTPGAPALLTVLTMDLIAAVYAAKVSLSFGGRRVMSDGSVWQVPAWAAPRWGDVPWMQRLRRWVGPTRF